MAERRVFQVEHVEGERAYFRARPTKLDGTPLLVTDVNTDSEEEDSIYPVWCHIWEHGSTRILTGSKSGTTIPILGGTYPYPSEGLIYRRFYETGFSRGSVMHSSLQTNKSWPHGAPGYTFHAELTAASAYPPDLDNLAYGVFWQGGNTYRVEFMIPTDSGDQGPGGAGEGRVYILYEVKVIAPGLRQQ